MQRFSVYIVLLIAVVLALLVWQEQEPDIWTDFETEGEKTGSFGHLVVRNNRKKGMKILQCDNSILGGIWTGHQFPYPLFNAFYIESAVMLSNFNSSPLQILQIGLGVGSVTSLILGRKWDLKAHVQVVEVDPNIPPLAIEHFGLSPQVQVTIDDGKNFLLQQLDRTFDVVIHDVFTAGVGSKHMMTLELFKDVKRTLKADGILVFTFIGTKAEEMKQGSEALICTLLHVFKHCRFFPEAPLFETSVLSIVSFCSEREIVFQDNTTLTEPPETVLKSFLDWEWHHEVRVCDGVPIISEDNNSLDKLQEPLQKQLWEQIQAKLTAE